MKATFWEQFKALLIRNLLLKWRNKRQTIQEIISPLYFVAILAVIKATTTPKEQPAISNPSVFSLDKQDFAPQLQLFLSPDTSEVHQLAPKLVEALNITNSSAYRIFSNSLDAENAYLQGGNSTTAGIDFSDGTLTGMLNYTIRLAYDSIPKAWEQYVDAGQCRSVGPTRYSCGTDQYLYSGFSAIQVALDTLLIQATASSPFNLTRPNISMQKFPKDKFTPSAGFILAMSAIYFVMAYSPFITFLVTNLVYEKEKRLKEAMRMMGMRDSAFWLSWAVVYAVIIAIVTAITVLVAYLADFFSGSNYFLFFLILFLYGLAIINIGFAITPFFERAQTGGALASLGTLLISILYLAVYFTKGPTGDSTLPLWAQYLMSLLPPVAVALGIDKGLTLSITGGGMTFANINQGVFPLSSILIMQALGVILFGLLAIYFDNVIPNEFGFKRKPYFFLQSSYWCPRDTLDTDNLVMENRAFTQDEDIYTVAQDTENMEAISPEYRHRNMISIRNLKKTYKTKEKEVKAVDGITLDIYEGQITALLGHNGAGKTTLLNMLTGMTPPTSGSATMYGLDVTDMGELNVLRTMIGYCPQHNILFDDLTPNEHLRYYGSIKGVSGESLQASVDEALKQVDLYDQRDTLSKNLSGGQKRKCCVAIALIGNPRVIFLDEPTAGMDPASRRHLWKLLKDQRDKLIVLTTHFMDEADILADRKAMVSKGQLRCVGSSLFLKIKFGVGYNLTLALEPSASADRIMDFIKNIVTDADCHRQHGKELIVRLPITSVSAFPDLFGALEVQQGDRPASEVMGILSYGVSMTNLEEVFLKIGQESDDDDHTSDTGEDAALIGNRPVNETMVNVEDGHNPLDQAQIIAGDMIADPKQLRNQRFAALFRVKRQIVFSNIPLFIIGSLFPLAFLIGAVCLLKFIPVPTRPPPQSIHLTPTFYANSTAAKAPLPSMLYRQSVPASVSSSLFVDKLRAQGLELTAIDNSTDLWTIAPHFLGADIQDVTNVSQVISSSLTALYNTTAVHSLPCIFNSFSTALLQMVGSPSSSVNSFSKPWPSTRSVSAGFNGAMFGFGMLFSMALGIIPPSFGVAACKDRVRKTKNQLRLAGATSILYWTAYLAFDLIVYGITSLIAFIIVVAFQIPAMSTSGAILSILLVLIAYVPINVLFAYVVSFTFSTFENAQSVLPTIFIWFLMLPFILVSMLDNFGQTVAATICHYVLCFTIPTYPLIGGIHYINRIYERAPLKSEITIGQYFEWSSNIPIVYVTAFFHIVLWSIALRVADIRSDGGNWRDAFRWSETNKVANMVPIDNPDRPEDEDEDVIAERRRVDEAVTSSNTEVIKVKNLRKEFTMSETTGSCGSSSEKTRVAVRNTSLLVETGEVMGLLGPNGAGKTTTLNMIIAEMAPTKGKVVAAGYDVNSNMSEAFQAMGYCPQHDTFWDELTLRQHLECFASLRGIGPSKIPPVIDYFLKSLQIEEHADKMAKKLSGGTKRKLSYIISMLAEPKVVLMDEPSTGMDPKSKRFLWDTITESFNNDKRGAILTTHYMDEADALCSRVGIMVNGQMECLGSTQRLKQKFGGGYLVEIKLKPSATEEETVEKVASVRRYIQSVFQGAQEREQFGARVQFQVPSTHISSLSKTFEVLEKGKESHDIEEYSFSQATLEQVFLEFAKYQLDENEDGDDLTEVNNRKNVGHLRRQLSEEVVRSHHF